MLKVFKKIWNFSKEEQANIKKSILAGFFHAVFNALQFGAIYYMLVNILSKTLDYKAIFICLGILVISLSLIHISEPTRQCCTSRMPSSA